MYFTCEVHSKRFPTLETLKQHDKLCHSKEEHIAAEHQNREESDDENGETGTDSNEDSDPDYAFEGNLGHKHSKTESDNVVNNSDRPGRDPDGNSKLPRPFQGILNNSPRSQYYNPLLPKGQVSCYFCGYIPTPTHVFIFERHIWTHTMEHVYRCRTCGKRCSGPKGLVGHEKTHSSEKKGDRPYKCEVCSSSFKDHGTLWKHSFTHTSHRPLQCPHCDKRWKRPAELKRHIRCSHSEKTPFKCHLCERGYKRKDLYKIHMEKYHPQEELRYHESPKELRLFCNKCFRGFAFETEYNRHMLSVHPETPPNLCPACDRVYSRGREFRKHLKTKRHLQNVKVNQLKSDRDPGQSNCNNPISINYNPCIPLGKIECYFCSYVPPDDLLPYFDKHIWTHTKEKLYTCKKCGQSWPNLNMLRDHEEERMCFEKRVRLKKVKNN